MSLARELGRLVGADHVLPGTEALYLQDATESRGCAAARTRSSSRRTPRRSPPSSHWCYEHDVADRAARRRHGLRGRRRPLDGGVVLSLERLDAGALVRAAPLADRGRGRRAHRATLRRLARESGLFFPPDPGAAEQSQIGGNVATNAGGPHAFKYGVTGAWVTGLEAVSRRASWSASAARSARTSPATTCTSLLVGSEGTLGVVTAAWLRLLPAPEAALPVGGLLRRRRRRAAPRSSACSATGCRRPRSSTSTRGTLAAAGGVVPRRRPGRRRLPRDRRGRRRAPPRRARCGPSWSRRSREGALGVVTPDGLRRSTRALALARRRRRSRSPRQRGGKVERGHRRPRRPPRRGDRRRRSRSAARHGLEACSWGHAGDGNLHSTFLLARERRRTSWRAPSDAAERALRDGGRASAATISGEHGIGWLKRGQLARQWAPRALELHARRSSASSTRRTCSTPARSSSRRPVRGAPRTGRRVGG